MSATFQIGAVLCGGIALFALQGEAREVRGQDDITARVEQLEQRLTQLQAENAELVAHAAENRALIDETSAYLEEQASSAEAMTAVLADSEKLGFTAGINFESREALLAGWRKQLKAIQEDLPGADNKEQASGRPGGRAQR